VQLSSADAELSLVAVASPLVKAAAVLLLMAVASLLVSAFTMLSLVVEAVLSPTALAMLSLVALAVLFSTARARLPLMAVALLSPVAIAVLPLTATAWEVESEVQVLVPFWTLVMPFLLTHTSAPWAKAIPEKTIVEVIIAPTANPRMRFMHDTSFSSPPLYSPFRRARG
jgi:hypothetical protein